MDFHHGQGSNAVACFKPGHVADDDAAGRGVDACGEGGRGAQDLEVPGADENPITVSIAPHPRDIVTNIIAAIEAETGMPVPKGP